MYVCMYDLVINIMYVCVYVAIKIAPIGTRTHEEAS